MRALVFTDVKRLDIQEIDDPVPGPGEVKIKVHCCGICGSDVHGYLGKTGRRIPPMVMGHEFSGEVAELGEGVNDLALGTHVTAYPLLFCEKCDCCLAGRTNICTDHSFLGVFRTAGAMAEYVCVPRRCVVPLADHVQFQEGAAIEPMAVGYHAVKQAGNLEGKSVLIIGAGTIGLMALMFVMRENPAHIVVSDLNDSRLEIARRMGADVVNSSKEDVPETLKRLTGNHQVDVTIEAVGIAPTVSQSIDMLKNGGTAVWVGNSAKSVEVPMQKVVTSELSIRGTHIYGLDEYFEIANMLAAGSLSVDPLISKVCTLEDAPLYFERLAHAPGDLVKVIIRLS